MGLIQSFGPGEAFAWCFFFFFLCVTPNPTKLGFHSPHPQALPLLNLSSAAPDLPPPRRPCGVAGGDTQLLWLALRRPDLACPDAEHAAAAGGASCEAAAAIWAERERAPLELLVISLGTEAPIVPSAALHAT